MHPLLLEVERTGGSDASVDALRSALADGRGPLYSAEPGGGIIVSFVWIGEAPQVSLQCGLVDHGTSAPLHRIAGSDVWMLEAPAATDTLVSYRYVIDDPFLGADARDDREWQRLMLAAQERSFADPFNPHRIPPLATLFGLTVEDHQWESILSLPDAPDDHWFAPHDAPEGSFDRFDHHSTSLGDTRTITVQIPHGPPGPRPLVVLLDGPSWLHIAGLARAIDAAVHLGEIDAPVVAYVHEAHGSSGLADRTRELSCNPQHARMLADELIPFLRSRHQLEGPSRTVLGGASLGGLASTFTAWEHPHTASNVLSVSGSYWYGTERDGEPEWLTRRIASGTVHPMRLYQQIGRLENGPLSLSPGVSHLDANRNFRDVARDLQFDVTYEEMGTSHDIAAFRVAVMHGLVALLPRTAR